MQTNSFLMNNCMFEGYLYKEPEYTQKKLAGNKTLHIAYITLKQPPDRYIQCVGIGNFAIKIKALGLSENDKVYIQATFCPHTTHENKYVMRFVIDKLIVMEKKTSPIPLEYQSDNNTYDLLEFLT